MTINYQFGDVDAHGATIRAQAMACEKLLTVDELDLPEPTFPLDLQVVDESIKSLIDLLEAQLREEMRTAVYRTARECYGKETIANPLLDIYQHRGYRGHVTRARARA